MPEHPAPPVSRRSPAPPRGPGANDRGSFPRGGGFGPRPDYERRFRELDEKLDRLLKELERMKDEKKPSQTREPRPRGTRLANPGTAVVF
jgi:hypothetical protein